MTIMYDGRFAKYNGVQLSNMLNNIPCEMACINSDADNLINGANSTTPTLFPLGNHAAGESDRIKYLAAGPDGVTPCVRFRLYKGDRLSYDDALSPGHSQSNVLRAEMGYYSNQANTTNELLDGAVRWYWTSFWIDTGYGTDQFSSVFQFHNSGSKYMNGTNVNLATNKLTAAGKGWRHLYQFYFTKISAYPNATLPAPLQFNTNYVAYNPTEDPNSFQVCATLADATAATPKIIALTSVGTMDGTTARTTPPETVQLGEWRINDLNIHHPSIYVGQDHGGFFAYNFIDLPGYNPAPISNAAVGTLGKVQGLDKDLWHGIPIDSLASRWNEVVVRAVWATDKTGELTFWLNGKKLYTEKVFPNQGWEQITPYMKVGLYASGTWPLTNPAYLQNYNQGVVYANTAGMTDSYAGFMTALGWPTKVELPYQYSSQHGCIF